MRQRNVSWNTYTKSTIADEDDDTIDDNDGGKKSNGRPLTR